MCVNFRKVERKTPESNELNPGSKGRGTIYVNFEYSIDDRSAYAPSAPPMEDTNEWNNFANNFLAEYQETFNL